MGLIYFDIPELQGTNTEIALANLLSLEHELENVVEKRLAHLSELAKAILKDGGDEDIVRSIILSIKSDGSITDKILDVNIKEISAIFSNISLLERLTVFKEVFGNTSEKKNAVKKMLLSNDFPVPEEAVDRIAYMNNSYTDTVYINFSSLISNPRASYYDSVIGVCESVYNDKCEYCILPTETAKEGRLAAFYEMIIKYDLHINAVYDLYDSDEYTRYALLSKNKVCDILMNKSRSRNWFFEFILTDPDGISIKDTLIAADFCSLELHRLDTISMTDKKNEVSHCFSPVFRTSGADMRTFLSFLSVDCPGYRIIGYYLQV